MFTQFNLDPQLMKAIEALNYSAPTPVQLQAIPAAMAGNDIMVCAETGSGKTAAFVLPILHKLINKQAPDSSTRVLILAPTRELARQLFKQCEALAKYTSIEAGLITGGESFKFQAATFRKNPEIIVSTPGRLIDHLGRKPNLMNDVEVLVLDEADRMLDMGFAEDVVAIAEHCDAQKQTMLFSATMNQKGIRHVIKQVLNAPTNITVDAIKGSHGNIKQQVMLADDDQHKDRLLTWMLANETYRQCIIFSNTKAKTDELYHFLRYHKHKVGVLHGDMTQDERNHIMSRMQQGHVSVLVATDVASRGLDVKNIDLVINFDLPRSGDDYVHRI
ncbi:MAG: DEAD/DEAH box helicase, partial [Bermanella sp.]